MVKIELNFDYDKLGNRKSMVTPYGVFLYNYDHGNRLTSLTNHKQEQFSFTYDSANRLTEITRPGSKTNYAFDANSFLTGISHSKLTSSIINSFLYSRDSIGNRTSITSSRGIASYSYDAESQLKTVSNTEITGDYANESFNYDSLGNRLNDQLGNYSYDASSQRLTEDYKYFYFYDNNGNMSSRMEKLNNSNVTNYTYNSENQLVKIEVFENSSLIKTSEYFFDALGRRIRKKIVDHTNSSKSYARKYIYDGQEILAELDDDNTTLAVFTHSTLRTDDVLAVDVKDSKIASQTGSYFYLKDALGSIIDIVDSSGSIVQHYAYSAFGKILKILDGSGNDISTNPVVEPYFTYTGREWDAESGLYYYRARYYSPEIGRFISADSHPGVMSNPLTIINKYVYAGNNPIMNVDPNGKFFFTAILIGALVGGTIAELSGGNFIDGAFLGAVITGAVIAGAYVGGTASASALGQATSVLGTGFWGSLGSSIYAGGVGFLAGATAGAVVGAAMGGIYNQLSGLGSFMDGFEQGGRIGLVAGGLGGLYGAFSKLALADSFLGSLGGTIASNPLSFAAPAALLPFTGTFGASCGEFSPFDAITLKPTQCQ
jgi:RHS repeat-associated protein